VKSNSSLIRLLQMPAHYGGLALAASLLCLVFSGTLSLAQKSIPEQVEWSWYARPAHPDSKLPNVLLLGDSISRNYQPRVAEQLAGIANVYLFATSASISDPRLVAQITEFERLERVHFAVVHFNNGMHGWDYKESDYEKGFPLFVHAMKKSFGSRVALIWASTTPVKKDQDGGASNARIAARNAIAQNALHGMPIAIDDQYALMLQHGDLYADSVHFNSAGSQLQGDQAVHYIRAALAGDHSSGASREVARPTVQPAAKPMKEAK